MAGPGGNGQRGRCDLRYESLAWGVFAATGATAAVFAALTPLGNLLFDGELPWSWWQALPALVALAVAITGTRLGHATRRTPPMRLLAAG